MNAPRKPNDYWTDFKNVERETLLFASKQEDPGVMPSERQLRKAGLNGLAYAIGQHGGFPEVANRIGLTPRRRKNYYWRDFENLRREINQWIECFGTPGMMPTSPQLRASDRNDLVDAIYLHKGFPAVMLRMELRASYSKKPDRYWLDFDNVAREVLKWIKDYGIADRMPTAPELRDTNNESLVWAICKHHGGFSVVADRLGLETARKANGYWEEKSLDEELLVFVDQRGTPGVMPLDEELRQHGRYDLTNAIYRNEEGVREIAARLGLQCRASQPDGYWDDPETTDRDLLQFITECGSPGLMPRQEDLVAAGRGDLASAISNAPGGYFGTANRLGLDSRKLPKGYWDDIEKIAVRITAFNKRRGLDGAMPTKDELVAVGESDLAGAIETHGGYPLVAQKLGLRSISGSLGQRSLIEITLAYEVKSFFDFDIDDHVVETPERTWKVDIKVPGQRLVIEYDSAYYHQGHDEIDRRKTESLECAGWQVIRAREMPLTQLRPNDVVVPRNNNKQLANLVLAKAQDLCAIRLPGLAEYIQQSNLMNYSEAEACILQLQQEQMQRDGKAKST